MKDRIILVLKHIAFIVAVFIGVFAAFWFSMMIQLLDSTTKNVLGDVLFGIIYVGLAIAVFFIPLLIKWNFKKSAVLAVVLIAIYTLIAVGTNAGVHKYMETFTYEKWAEYTDERELMLDDLVSKYNFIGMKREEVKDILGDSDVMYADADGKDILEYRIDEGWFDPVMLSFEFENNLVVEAYTYTEFREAKNPLY